MPGRAPIAPLEVMSPNTSVSYTRPGFAAVGAEGAIMTTNPVNPFQPPEAEPDVVRPTLPNGSLEDALAGNYDFEISEVLREAWRLTNGFKAAFWGPALVTYGLVIALVFGATKVIAGDNAGFAVRFAINLGCSALFAPLVMGVMMLGVRRAAGLPVSFQTTFSYFHKAGAAIVAALSTTLLTYLGLVFLVLPAIYLGVAFGMTMPLIADRNLAPWNAMETSRRAITHKWFAFFGTYLIVGILTCLSALPLGIGLIWTVPWSMLVIGVLYRRIFGVASSASAAPIGVAGTAATMSGNSF
jgi:hypothetical protein